MTNRKRQVATSLIVLAAALLFVGAVSGTLLRHIVQIIPAVVALALIMRTPTWGAYAAAPLFVFWLLVVCLIWLFLLGLSGIASGHYSVAEVIATVIMAGASVIGVIRGVSLGRPLAWPRRVAAIIAFGAFQIAAMWVSFLPSIADR
jgi:hypothetical protein